MKFKALVAPTIGELFDSTIQDMILSGELAIGEKLPTEQELAEELRISKSAVHQGIKRLERQGFLRIVPRHGVFVANYPETGNLDTLVALLKHNGNKLDYKTVASVLQFREANEGMAVRMLAEKHTTGHILRLRMYIDDIKKAAAGSPAASPDGAAVQLSPVYWAAIRQQRHTHGDERFPRCERGVLAHLDCEYGRGRSGGFPRALHGLYRGGRRRRRHGTL